MAKSKKEIDKEIMFQKIMPSGRRTAAAEQEPPDAAQPAQPQPAAPASAPEAKPARPSPILAESGVQFREKNSMVLVNIMEYLVVEKLDAAFAKFNCCKCDKCRKDVAAIALNKLHPRYIVTDPDKISAWTATQNTAEVSTAIVQGILQVRAHPRH